MALQDGPFQPCSCIRVYLGAHESSFLYNESQLNHIGKIKKSLIMLYSFQYFLVYSSSFQVDFLYYIVLPPSFQLTSYMTQWTVLHQLNIQINYMYYFHLKPCKYVFIDMERHTEEKYKLYIFFLCLYFHIFFHTGLAFSVCVFPSTCCISLRRKAFIS